MTENDRSPLQTIVIDANDQHVIVSGHKSLIEVRGHMPFIQVYGMQAIIDFPEGSEFGNCRMSPEAVRKLQTSNADLLEALKDARFQIARQLNFLRRRNNHTDYIPWLWAQEAIAEYDAAITKATSA